MVEWSRAEQTTENTTKENKKADQTFRFAYAHTHWSRTHLFLLSLLHLLMRLSFSRFVATFVYLEIQTRESVCICQ